MPKHVRSKPKRFFSFKDYETIIAMSTRDEQNIEKPIHIDLPIHRYRFLHTAHQKYYRVFINNSSDYIFCFNNFHLNYNKSIVFMTII